MPKPEVYYIHVIEWINKRGNEGWFALYELRADLAAKLGVRPHAANLRRILERLRQAGLVKHTARGFNDRTWVRTPAWSSLREAVDTYEFLRLTRPETAGQRRRIYRQAKRLSEVAAAEEEGKEST